MAVWKLVFDLEKLNYIINLKLIKKWFLIFAYNQFLNDYPNTDDNKYGWQD